METKQEKAYYALQLREIYNEGWNNKIWDRVADFLGDDTTATWNEVFEVCEIEKAKLEAFFTEAELEEILNFKA